MPLITVILFLFFVLYLSFGIYILIKIPSSLKNRIFFSICLHLSIWSLGYALMSCASTCEKANIGREIASLGWCFIYSLWLDYTILLYNNERKKWMTDIRRLLIYLPSFFFFFGDLRYRSEDVITRFAYIWRDTYPLNLFEVLYNIYYMSYIIGGIVFVYCWRKKSRLSREKKQADTIIIATVINLGVGILIKFILPEFTINVFPLDILIFSISIFGIYHAMTKYQFMIMEQKQQIAKLESLGLLSGGIAHDFNNILSSILGYTQLTLEDLEGDSVQAQNLREILKLGDRAKNIIAQILTFNVNSLLKKEKVDIGLIVIEVIKMLEVTIPASVKIRYNQPKLPCYVYADAGEMHQLIMNLCKNAILAIDSVSGTVWIRLSEVECAIKTAERLNSKENEQYIQIIVSDNGCGMNEEVKKRIFEPFFTKRGSNGGTGLGLSLVQAIVHKMEGSIKVHSEIGKGSTFTILLPKYGESELHKPYLTLRSANSKVKILLVDNEEPIVSSIKKLLTSRGYIVTGVSDPQEALNQFIKEPEAYDIVLTDQSMPKLTGDELLIELRKIKPELPAIICSGQKQLQQHNNMEYLIKPVSIDDYIRIIEKLVKG